MQGAQPRIIARAVRRVRRWSVRARQEVQGIPRRIENHRGGGLPIPPSRLTHLVANSADVGWFLESGALAASSLRAILAENGIALESLGSVLDFGCGVGRVMRHWSGLRGPELHGTDYNAELVDWCERNLPFARFRANRLRGGLDYPAGSFELIYCLSVFTHLDEPLQFFWIDELTRLLRPGGHLFITTHGEPYVSQLTPSERRRYQAGELVVVGSRREGSNDCAAFHPERYVRETLARNLSVVDLIPEGAKGNPRQDVYLLRKP